MFAIELHPARDPGPGSGRFAVAHGRITVDDFTETFQAPLGYWDESGYRRSWQQVFEVLNAGPHATSCLMTSMTDPGTSNFLACWPVYRAGEDVYLQNALIFLSESRAAFDPAAPWDFAEPRRATGEDGNKISEWATSMDSLRRFFR
jgi:CdiI N-terminal domain